MKTSLDASAIVPLFVNDNFTHRITAFLIANQPGLIVSAFAAAEFASVSARRVPTDDTTEDEARAAFSAFDIWTVRAVRKIEARPADMVGAASFMRRLDLNLRTPDALNIAQRLAVDLVTFDEKMAASARQLGVSVALA